MNYLEELFFMLLEEDVPNTPEYRENQKIHDRLMGEVKEAMGEEMAEKVESIFTEHEVLDSQRYFHYGIRFTLELLRL